MVIMAGLGATYAGVAYWGHVTLGEVSPAPRAENRVLIHR
jgi:hypothetical protein